jgi:hypothetical protein
LQQLLRVFKHVAQLVAGCTQHFRSQLRGNLDSRHRPVFCHEPDFVDLDAWIARQRRLQLLGQRTRLCIPTRKGAHKTRKLGLCQIHREVNAGNA